MWTIQIMSELGDGHELPLAHLSFGFLHESAFFGGEHVIGINHAPGLDEDAVLRLSERHKVPLPDIEGFEHLPGNYHLAPLAHAANPLVRCGCSCRHIFQII
jgi:hypothetical protein